MQILLLSRYSRKGPSSRYRSYQYISSLQEHGCTITAAPLLDDVYIQRFFAGQRVPLWRIIRAYGQRALRLLRAGRYNLIWLEYEALPWIPAWLERLLYTSGVPYVVDYDDAIFHRYDQHTRSVVRWLLGTKIDRVMRAATLVIVGNEYLANRAQQARAARVEILPTVVDLNKYPLTPHPDNSIFTLGWIGSLSTSQCLEHIKPALQELCRDGTVRLVVMGAKTSVLPGIPVVVKPWCEDTGERGKCGFKLIQYMACARPVIGSPVGVNQQIIDHGSNGFQASSTAEWIQAVRTLKHDKVLRQRMGALGRAKVEQSYCLQVTAPRLLQLLREAKESRHVRH
jgi:glycosyltransferase involved in cell wall biosynthesis